MTSPRFSGPAERMGTINSLPSIEIPEDIIEGETSILKMVASVRLGTVAMLADEVRVDSTDSSPARASFIPKPELGLGRDEGQHQSSFGQMLINGQRAYDRSILVALKPFEHANDHQDIKTLAREWSTDNYLNSVSDKQLAYLPLGIWRSAQGISHLISLYEHDVISFDSIFWADKELHPEALRPKIIEQAFADSIRGLGYLHGVGVVHRDAEAKNLATDRKGIRFIDLESAAVLPRDKKGVVDTEETRRLIRNDLEMFFDSTMQVDENRSAVANVLAKDKTDEKFAKLYRSGLRQAKSDTGLRMPDLPMKTSEYFKTTIEHTLGLSHSA